MTGLLWFKDLSPFMEWIQVTGRQFWSLLHHAFDRRNFFLVTSAEVEAPWKAKSDVSPVSHSNLLIRFMMLNNEMWPGIIVFVRSLRMIETSNFQLKICKTMLFRQLAFQPMRKCRGNSNQVWVGWTRSVWLSWSPEPPWISKWNGPLSFDFFAKGIAFSKRKSRLSKRTANISKIGSKDFVVRRRNGLFLVCRLQRSPFFATLGIFLHVLCRRAFWKFSCPQCLRLGGRVHWVGCEGWIG